MASEAAPVPSPMELFEFLAELGTREISHSGRSLYEHLCGVYSILRAWEQRDNVCKAGLFHSIYSIERFHHVTSSRSERRRLQAAIGEEAEDLVYLFAVLLRAAVFQAANCWPSLSSSGYAEIPCYSDPSILLRVSGSQIVDLILLQIANRLEQAPRPATGIGFWLSSTSEMVTDLRAFHGTLPAALANLGTISLEEERRLHSLYLQGIALLQSGDPSAALTYLDSACRDCGFVGEPFLMQAVANRMLGNVQRARQAAVRGRELLKSWGVPWHKHLCMESWCKVADLITADKPIEDVTNLLREMSAAHERAQAPFTEESGSESNGSASLVPATQAGASRFFTYLKAVQTERSTRAINQAIKWYPGLSRKAWYDSERFPVARALESSFTDIRVEALRLEANHYYEEAEEIGRTGNWQVCMFYEHGRRNGSVCDQCPTTVAILEGHDSVRRSAGLIYLSKLAPHTHIAAHQARSNIRLRCHLALRIPGGDCAIRVGHEVHRWEEGKCIVFDDTFEHEVWNRTNEERLVLLLDLWHPDLTRLERDALEAINLLSMYRASGMVGTWQRNDSQREREGKLAVEEPQYLFD
jgi:aspartyl/asparaginyl beta-hydroxylase (cupin superfamily)